MRLALLADIHGNNIALEAVLADLEQLGSPDVTWVLGDLALFGSQPHESIQAIQNLPNVHIIQGNTDRYIAASLLAGTPPDEQDPSVAWAAERLRDEDLLFLANLPTILTEDVEGYGVLAGFHAAPGDDEFGLFPDTPDDVVSEKLGGSAARLVAVGHTHLVMDRQVGDWRVLNPGSVGLPFDEDPRAAYAVLDFDDLGGLTLNQRRVAYDIDREVEQLHALGQPVASAQEARLRTGLRTPPTE